MRWAGAAYLCVLGVRALRAALAASPAATPEVSVPVRRLASRSGSGCFTNLLNPKIGVFYLAALPQFLPHDVPALPASIAPRRLVHDLEGLIWFTVLIFVVAAPPRG